MVTIKSEQELETLRENAQVLASILQKIEAAAREGVSTKELDALAEKLIRDADAEPAFKGYRGYPASVCTSINEEVVHGIPSRHRVLKKGDVLSIDTGIKRKGYYADLATTIVVGGEPSDRAKRLIDVAWTALDRGIEQARSGNRVSDISHAIGLYVEAQGYSVVKTFVGHGIGREMHEDPQVPNYGPAGKGARLRPGMVLAIEPMVKEDPEEVEVADDGWTARTTNGGLAAHVEEMVLITERGPERLSRSRR
jgi:methionyl aminopeptidase